ncbi:predicted protein [Sclerotinia sclerotiorum 1980 UF-70]|uniref:Uncharacterized protein n=1 Tax=Sclerotinia sclerotiorum (strain ATCC 18683 / 1980 / Ss-1) TaxID=665079 RepID=A7F386_SCLS1|nr:predicted protein [Sclerotinia sclerotiorum 1980 UF-70]EDN97207.1 predicted protein [Sclerotinia sclerotiorum 1980 UF-70]
MHRMRQARYSTVESPKTMSLHQDPFGLRKANMPQLQPRKLLGMGNRDHQQDDIGQIVHIQRHRTFASITLETTNVYVGSLSTAV